MNSRDLAPVAFFIFNRPQVTAQVYARIRAARPARLLVVADGPRRSRPEEAELCRATRQIVSSPDWPCELLTNFADENLGCRRRVSSGIDWVFQQCSEAIILEDDCLPCPAFFAFCSTMLNHYRDDPRIMHVSGNNFQGGRIRGEGSYFFSRYPLSWGWATWRRAWQYYDVKVASWPEAYRNRWLESILDDPEEMQHWEGTFDSLYRGRIDTWDYQWLFACWRRGGLSILPNVNLVTNIGIGPDATHFREGHSTLGIPTGELGNCIHPSAVIRDAQADQFMFKEHIASRQELRRSNWVETARRKLALRTRLRQLVPRSLRYRLGTSV
jgi:hypothetical protein